MNKPPLSSSKVGATSPPSTPTPPHFDIAGWEKKSALSNDLFITLNNINKIVTEDKPLPEKFREEEERNKSKRAKERDESRTDDTAGLDVMDLEHEIDNISAYYDWFSMINQRNIHLHQYEYFLESLVDYTDGSDHLLKIVEDCETLVDSIQSDYSNLTKKTNQLFDSCEKFFKEELRLRYIALSISEKLKYFNELEIQSKKFNSNTLNVTDPNFIQSLETVENSINFMKKNNNFLESPKYLTQYGFLFSRGLGIIKEYISVNLKILSKEIIANQRTEILKMIKLEQQQQQQQQQLLSPTGTTPTTTTTTTTTTNTTPTIDGSTGTSLNLPQSPISVTSVSVMNQDLNFMESFQNSNIKFKAFAPKLQPLCAELEKRVDSQSSQSFLIDTYKIYFNCRRSVLSYLLYDKFNLILKLPDVITMIKSAALFIYQFFDNEYNIYSHYFSPSVNVFQKSINESQGSQSSSGSNSINSSTNSTFNNPNNNNNSSIGAQNNNELLSEMLDEYTQQLYDTIRPVYIQIHSFEILCNLAHVIRNELMEDIVIKTQRYSLGFKSALDRILQDIQERLIYLVQTYVRDEIKTYIPVPADLDYPNKLINLYKEVEQQQQHQSQNNNNNNLSSSSNSISSASSTSTTTLNLHKALYTQWYPTLEKSLGCLSKIYLVLENKIFEGLAIEVVQECSKTLIDASKTIASQKPDALLDSQLFLIKHLLALREQIAPFDINFVTTERIVDFPNLKNPLVGIQSYSALWSFSTNNPLYNILSPRVNITNIDSKKELELQLKNSIESFIMFTANSTVTPLLSQLAKISAFLNQSTRNNTDLKLISQQSFAEPPRIKENIELVLQNINQFTPELISKMKLYLTPNTLNLLMKPIRSNITDCFSQLSHYLKQYYTPEEQQTIQLSSMDQINELLDKLLPIKK